MLEAVQHPLIVQHIAHGTGDDGALWLAMEWLEGVTLDARLQEGALPVADALLVAHQIAEALAAIHAIGITHRDLKPSNVLLREGRVDGVVLLDFGVARAAASTSLVTEASSLVGSLGYVAPEQARGDTEVDARADVFGLGVLLFECLAGQRPFAADDPLAEVCRILLEEAPRSSSGARTCRRSSTSSSRASWRRTRRRAPRTAARRRPPSRRRAPCSRGVQRGRGRRAGVGHRRRAAARQRRPRRSGRRGPGAGERSRRRADRRGPRRGVRRRARAAPGRHAHGAPVLADRRGVLRPRRRRHDGRLRPRGARRAVRRSR